MIRRLHLVLATLALWTSIVPAWGQQITAVETVGFTVSDMDRAVDFYSRVLTFEKVGDQVRSGADFGALKNVPNPRARVVRMRLGDEQIELTQYLGAPGRPFPAGSRGNDRWFQHIAIITRDMDRAYARLRQYRVRHASSAPQTLPAWNPNAAGIRAFYFRDPDGHFLEILQFPPDKGLEKWRRPGDDLFLGIDHTAIVVADTDQSLRFYRDLLGMRVAGQSDNYGVEQEHLNGVFGAHLRITALRAGSGPGIELLEYLSPADGRPYPAGVRANDIVHWETRVAARDAAAAARSALAARRVKLISAPAAASEFLARDPDGHVLAFRSNQNLRVPQVRSPRMRGTNAGALPTGARP